MRRRDFLGTFASGVAGAFWPRLWPQTTLGIEGSGTGPPVPQSSQFVERWSWAMGQPVHLQLFAESTEQGYAAASATFAELRRVEQHLSLFDDTSDLSELNRRAGKPRRRFGPDVTTVLQAAIRFQDLTGGAFNPAVEPLMRAWGFHAPRSAEPSSVEVAEARAAVSAARIHIEAGKIFLPEPSTRLDLGGIGVGYGLDRAAALLRKAGIRSAFLDVSGDCIAIGSPPGQEDGWLVQIAQPEHGLAPLGSTRIRDSALATSANTRSVVHYGRIVRGHVMDPATGWPAGARTQITVVARTGLEADALSTAMLVSGRPVEGVVRYYRP